MNPTPALLVEPTLGDALVIMPVLTGLGFEITATDNFEEARRSMKMPPKLLLTELRLGEFNGLHLVLRGRAVRTDMCAIVMSSADDPALRAETEALGATFLLKPLIASELYAAVIRTVLRDRLESALPLRPPYERRTRDRRVLDRPLPLNERRALDRRRSAAELIGQLAVV